METIVNNSKRVLTSTAKVRDFMVHLRSNIELDILMARYYRSTGHFLLWFWWTFHIFKMKRNLKNANAQLIEFVLVRFKLKSNVFRSQYLQRDLKAALRIEDYETASLLRDEINLKKT